MKSNKKGAIKPINEELQIAMAQPHIMGYTKDIKATLEDLRKILRQWNLAKSFTQSLPKETQLLKDYIEAQHHYYEEDQFDQNFSLLEHFELNLAFIEDMGLILKSFKLFPKAIWPVRFHSKFVSKVSAISNPDELYYVLSQVYAIACGHISTFRSNNGWIRPISTKVIPMNRYFSMRILRERNIFIHIGVEKVPIIKNGIIKRYEFVQFMHFLDILGDQYVENRNKLDQRMNFFTGQIYSDAARKDHSEEIEIDRMLYFSNKNRSNNYFFKQSWNDYTEKYEYYQCHLEDNKSETYYPVPFKPYYVSVAENSTVIFDQATKRWLSKDHLTFLERRKLVEYQKQVSDAMVKRFVDFQSAKSLVELLTKIPNFKVSLTEQEKQVIGENGNVLAIGRSGTGKTTCAVLRLFSIEMLFKIRLSLSKKKFQSTLEGVRCGSDDIDSAVGLHCIFLTASPVLTHEIQRYYKKLTDNIKTELEKKKQRVEAEERKKREEEEKEREGEKSMQEASVVEQSFEQLNATEEEMIQPQPNLAQSVADSLQVPTTLPPRKSTEQIEQQRQMQEQFQGVELNQDIKNEQFKQDEAEEDIDQMKNKFQQSVKRFQSLFDLSEADYPGFFTVKSFIMMIDGTLQKPFFIRTKHANAEEDSKASWHNERKGVMMIENYYRGQEEEKVKEEVVEEEEFNYSDEEELQHEYLRQIQLRENKEKQQLTKKLTKNKVKNMLSFEVDYEYFLVHFWPRVVKKYYSSRSITPHLVWTEIYSTIKGSAQAHQYPGQYLSQRAYIDISANTFLTREEKMDIYQTFCQYERWKIRSGGYDIMDAVNYVLNVIRYRGYEGPEIHYIMIDQVQDLPHAMIYLLSKTANYGVFYSGDTAQTIAKGVGFRFCDLRSLFNKQIFSSSLQLKAPVMKHLTVNFRSHNNILQLANSVVSALEILFPKTIDRLKKEVSDLHGPKPMILASGDEELLFYVLCGGEEKKEETGGMKKPPLEFGCDQVIIVRDQQSKSKVPPMLQHALCLTIYEAKGLEFNDVILFNFFEESPCPEKWHLLKNLYVVTSEIPKEEYEKNLSRHNQPKETEQPKEQAPKKEEGVEEQPAEEEVFAEQTFNKKTNCYTVKKLINNNNKSFRRDTNDYAELCSQLKLLYTAITRPKKTLIIYDAGQANARSSLQRIWQRLDVIQLITKQLVMQSLNRKAEASVSQQVKIFKTIVTSTSSEQWKQQGLKMYARGFFDQAMKCFDRSGHKELYHKAEANRYADQATRKLIEIQSERNTIKQGGAGIKEMNRSQLSRLKKKLKSEEAESLKKFLQAGRIFQDMQMFKQAGQCFFSGKSFDRAYQNFCKAFMYRQAGESLQMQNRYRQASQYYEKQDNYLKVIECLDMVNEWTLILEKIHKFANRMTDYEKQALLKKYSALALEELVYEIEFENEEEAAKPQNNRVQVIQEKESQEEDEDDESQEEGQGDEEEEEGDDDEDPEIAAQREYERKMSQEISNPSRKQSQDPDALKPIDIKQSVYQQLGQPQDKKEPEQADNSMSFSALNASQANEQKPANKQDIKSIDQSFGDLNRSQQPVVLQGVPSSDRHELQSIGSSFSDLSAKYENQLQPDLESIRSLVDPEDLWVKNSISEINQKVQSQYSVMDDLEQGFSLNAKIIKTKGNIFVQEEIMKKIVNIVSIINSSVQKFFSQFKGYQSLITVSKPNKGELLDIRPEISDFQQIDPQFINIILDTLESFKLFKLCLFVCNRYHLPAKAGRYLISLGMKYSTNCISNNAVNPILLAPSAYRKLQLEKGILASIALHAIYENVNAEFLKVKVAEQGQGSKNSLGTYFIEGLVLEGLYKKAVFMVNPQEGLKITENYNDFEAFSNIYHHKIVKRPYPELPLFAQNPKTVEDWAYTKMLLRKAVLEYCIVHKFETISSRYYKEFQLAQIDPVKRLGKYTIPKYLPFTHILFSSTPEDLVANFKALLPQGYAILTKGNSVQCLDFISTLMIVVHSEQHHNKQAELHAEDHANYLAWLDNDDFLELFRCLDYIKTVLRKLAGLNVMNILQAVLSIHQCYRITYCRSMSFLSDTFTFVKRTSTIANDFVQNPKAKVSSFAYFFEQDYNYILVKTERAVKAIGRKFEEAVARIYRRRIQLTVNKRKLYLFEDWARYEEEMVIRKALSFQVQSLGDPKKRKKQSQAPNKKTKELKSGYDFRCKNRDQVVRLQDSSSSQQEEYVSQQPKFYRSGVNPKMRYLSHAMHHQFNGQATNNVNIVQGRNLYGAGLIASYRLYADKCAAGSLFNALEFQRFKRVDLFAENVLSVYEQLTLFSKHNFLAQVLTLLLVQLKTIENPKGFALSVQTDSLRYFQQLKFTGTKQGQAQSHTDIDTLLAKGVECKFSYINRYVSELDTDQLSGLVCDFLSILQDEQASQIANLPAVVVLYVLNMGKNDKVNEVIRKVIRQLGTLWKEEVLHSLIDTKSVADYQNKRRSILTSPIRLNIQHPLHTISVDSKGDLDKAIADSQFDYELQTRIIKGKERAVSKIVKWWKAKRIQLKEKRGDGANYFEWPFSLVDLLQARRPGLLGDIRLIRAQHKGRTLSEIQLLSKTEKAKTELISFYLSNTISSSLDFHFILMSLNRIDQTRKHYFQFCSEDTDQLHQFDLEQIQQEMADLLGTIDVWKADEKWLREKNVNLKRKKVFEVKWMTKNIGGFGGILKKRAGLKKQALLQDKRKYLKRNK